MGNVVEELKKQMQVIQYYSLLQKLFISYVFKQLEGHIENATKNNQQNNFNGNFPFKPNQNFSAGSGNQFPFFPGQDMDYMNMNNMNMGMNANMNMPNMDKDQMNFIKQMQNSGFNFPNFPGQNFNQPSQPSEKFPSGNMPASDQQGQNTFQNPIPNAMNNPKELLKNLYSSINSQMNNSNFLFIYLKLDTFISYHLINIFNIFIVLLLFYKYVYFF